MIGALVACGVPPWFMVAHSAGEQFDGLTDARGERAAAPDRSAGATFRLERSGFAGGRVAGPALPLLADGGDFGLATAGTRLDRAAQRAGPARMRW
jgi:hypothetical protein